MKNMFILLCIISFTYSFANSNFKSVNFEEVLSLTYKNNKDLKEKKLNIKLAKLSLKEIKSYSLGKISLRNQISRTNHAGHIFNSKLSSRLARFKDFGFAQMNEGLDTKPSQLNEANAINNVITKITYDLVLFTGFKLSKQEDILNLQIKAGDIQYSLNKELLFFEVLKAYNGAVVAKESIKAIKKAKESIKFIEKSANAFYKEGLITKIDLKQAKVHSLNIDASLIEARNKFDLSIEYLKFLTSDDFISNIKDLKYIYLSLDEKDILYKKALDNSKAMMLKKLHSKMMKKNIEISKSSYYPQVYSHFEYGFNDNNFSLDTKKDYYMASVALNYTLFDNTRNIKVLKNKIIYNKTKLLTKKLESYIKLQLEKYLLNLQSKEKILKAQMQAKNLAQEVFYQSELMYKNHLISMTNLLEQEASLRKNESKLLFAKYNKSLALAKLAIALGKNKTNDKEK